MDVRRGRVRRCGEDLLVTRPSRNEGGNKEPFHAIAGSTYLLVVAVSDTAARFFGDGLDIERHVPVG